MNSAEMKELIRKDIEMARAELTAREHALQYVEQLLITHPEPNGLDALFDNPGVPVTPCIQSKTAHVFYRHVCPKCKKILVNRHAKMNCISDKTLMISNKVTPKGKYKKGKVRL